MRREIVTIGVHVAWSCASQPSFSSPLPSSLPFQDDVLYSFLTVQETLTLATHFYLPSALSEQEKATYVRDVINALGLAKARNTIIGREGWREGRRERGGDTGCRARVGMKLSGPRYYTNASCPSPMPSPSSSLPPSPSP